VHGYTAESLAQNFAFARVKTDPNLDPKLFDTVSDRPSAASGSCRAIEGGKEAVSGCVDLSTTEASKLTTD
jgi:hypothetical protein